MNYPINNTDISMVKGITNEVYFFVKDVDRKPVTANAMANANISNVRIVITDPNSVGNSALLLGSQLPPIAGDASYLIPAPLINSAKGCWFLSLNSSVTNDWPIGGLNYNIICDRITGGQVLLYTDRNYTPSGQIQMLRGPFPEPSATIHIANAAFLYQGLNQHSGAYHGAAQVGNLSGIHSVVANVSNFTGTITVQGSLENQAPTDDSDWFAANITSYSVGDIGSPGTVLFYQDQSTPIYISFQGNYMWIRFIIFNDIINSGGDFYSLDYRND